MAEENKIREAETSEVPEIETGEKRKRKISTEMVLIFLIGFLFGIAVKTEFAKRINVIDMTFYGQQGYNFSALEEMKALQDQAAQPAPETEPGQ